MRAFGCSAISNISRLPAVSSLLCRNLSCSAPRLIISGMAILSRGRDRDDSTADWRLVRRSVIDASFAPIATKLRNATKCCDVLGRDVRGDLHLISAQANSLELLD